MVRINLLPQRRDGRRTSDANQTWIAAIFAAVLVEVVALFFVHDAQQDDLKRVTRENRRITADLDSIRADMANHDQIKKDLKRLKDRENAITKLQTARTGPTATLLEISHILTPGRGPTADNDKLEQLRRDNPQAVPNPSWDTRRLWLTNYAEQQRRVRLAGFARDGEDVSEFLRRLDVSSFFTDVKLLPAARTRDEKSGLEVVRFELSAKVKY